jgi:phosphate transport system permease protein
MLWLTAGALILAIAMIAGLIALVAARGTATFWPEALVLVTKTDGTRLLGDIQQEDHFVPASPDAHADRPVRRRKIRTENFELSGSHYQWISDTEIASEERPPWALLVERQSWGRFYGTPSAFEVDDQVVATDPERILALFGEKTAEADRGNTRRAIVPHGGRSGEKLLADVVRIVPGNRLDLTGKIGVYLPLARIPPRRPA